MFQVILLPRSQMGLILTKGPFSEIYQVTGPVERFAGQIASHGYVVGISVVPVHFMSHIYHIFSMSIYLPRV